MKKFLFLFLYSISFISFSQNLTIDKQQLKSENKEIIFTQEQKNILDNLLKQQEYQEFFNKIQLNKNSKSSYISYLLSKKDDGIIPIYWLISDYYAKEKNYLETHKWFYIALIMTQQDSYLCFDETAKNAPRILMKSFPESIDITRKTPQYIDISMREVIFFINNLKTRIPPDWVCNYGEQEILRGREKIKNKESWNKIRSDVFNKFTNKYQK